MNKELRARQLAKRLGNIEQKVWGGLFINGWLAIKFIWHALYMSFDMAYAILLNSIEKIEEKYNL